MVNTVRTGLLTLAQFQLPLAALAASVCAAARWESKVVGSKSPVTAGRCVCICPLSVARWIGVRRVWRHGERSRLFFFYSALQYSHHFLI